MSISKTWLKAAGLGAMLTGGIGLASPAVAGDEYLFVWDDSVEGHLFGDTYKNDVLIQHVDTGFGGEDYPGTYGLWRGHLLADFDVGFNIYDSGGLSDTWHIFGKAGDNFFWLPFHSDGRPSTLLPLSNGIKIRETGARQNVFAFTTSSGDYWVLGFRSDADDAPGDAPEPASWALMLGGFGTIGAALRRKRTVVAFG